MIEELLLPEDILQLDKLNSATELTDDTSFLAIIGIDTLELNNKLNSYINLNIKNHIYYKPKSSKILNELVSFEDKSKFIIIDMFESTTSEFIKDLLFYRDLISDNKLKIILIVNQNDYKYILKNAIDFYNINTFAYLFNTYKVDIVESVNKDDLDKFLEEYKTKKMTFSKVQKATYLYEIGDKYSNYGETKLALKFLNESLSMATKLKNNKLIHYIKFQLANMYRITIKYNLSKKYLLEIKKFTKKNTLEYKQILNELVLLYSDMNDISLALKTNKELEQISIDTNDKRNELEALRMFFILCKETAVFFELQYQHLGNLMLE